MKFENETNGRFCWEICPNLDASGQKEIVNVVLLFTNNLRNNRDLYSLKNAIQQLEHKEYTLS